MQLSARFYCHAVLASALLTLAACGGKDSGNEVADGGRDADDPCAGFSVDAAADLLDVDARELVRSASPDAAVSCTFRSPHDPDRVLAYSVRRLDNEAAATARLESIARMLEKISPIERAETPGDAAVFAPGPGARRAVVQRGSLVIDLFEPTDPELQRRALAAIVARL